MCGNQFRSWQLIRLGVSRIGYACVRGDMREYSSQDLSLSASMKRCIAFSC